LKVKPCDDEDFENFYPPSKTTVTKFNLLKEKKTLMCIETQDEEGQPIDLRIWGSSENEPHRRLDLSFMPCTPVVDRDPNVECRISENTQSAYRQKLNEIKLRIRAPDF
jgi:hypothetical protein